MEVCSRSVIAATADYCALTKSQNIRGKSQFCCTVKKISTHKITRATKYLSLDQLNNARSEQRPISSRRYSN